MAFAGLARLIAEEWRNRRELADGVTTPNVDRLMAAAAAAGAKASKLCGAGGGGCMITVIGDDDDTLAARPGDSHLLAARSGDLSAVCARVEAALTAAGARIIPFKIARTGVRVEVRTDDDDGLNWLTTVSVGAGLASPVTVAGVEAAATQEETAG
jgi:hypothetical protein